MVSKPDPMPVTTPVLDIRAVALLLLHTPPFVAQLNVVVPPAHTKLAPVIGATTVGQVSIILSK